MTASRAITGNRNPLASCEGKVAYSTLTQASRAAQRQRRRHEGARIGPYHCVHCHRFHTGEGDGRVLDDRRHHEAAAAKGERASPRRMIREDETGRPCHTARNGEIDA